MNSNIKKLSIGSLCLGLMLSMHPYMGSTEEEVQTIYTYKGSSSVTQSNTVAISTPGKTIVQNGNTTEFYFFGHKQEWIVPVTGRYKLEVWGAQGGNINGGRGGYAKGEIDLSKDESIYVFVGEKGADNALYDGIGSWNGGGEGTCTADGGGGTDIRRGGTNLYDRIIVGGGGGGSYGELRGGNGGGLEGENSPWQNHYPEIVTGGTQTEGGNYGAGFGYGGSTSNYFCGGGGGGGWYGGGVIIGEMNSSGAGGSSYVGNLLNPSTESGVQFGNGFARITHLDQQAAELTKITINQRSLNLPVNTGIQLNVVAHYTDGSTIDITNQVTYRSANNNILSVNISGYVLAVGRGSAEISVTYKEKNSAGITKMVSARVKGTVY